MSVEVEKRRHQRVPFEADVLCRYGNQQHFATAVDISEGGLALRTKAEIRVGQRLDVMLELAGRTIDAEARVVRAVPPAGYALQFIALKGDGAPHLKDFIKTSPRWRTHPSQALVAKSMAVETLIVDDEESVLTLLNKVLQPPRFHVRTAKSAESALNVGAGAKVDLLITDKNLPGIGGLDLAATLGKKFPAAAVVLMTAVPDHRDVAQGKIDGYLPKPFSNLKTLPAVIEGALDNRRRAQERDEIVRQLGELKTRLTASQKK